MKHIVLFTLFLISFSAMAGSSSTYGSGFINCKSKSGRTQINIVAKNLRQLDYVRITVDSTVTEYYYFVDNSIEFSKSDKKLKLKASKNESNDVFSITLSSNGAPFVYKINKKDHIDLSFKAISNLTDPRDANKKMYNVQLTCELTYEI
ncbi:MAG: hypothetical protein HRT71_04025 [Flavobacteriales bacterium]|nr:hypothetical protein [Flavobacteriales bacterium]